MKTFYCQVDSFLATKDYLRKGRCVRLIGVMPHEYSDIHLADGVTTYTIDIDYWEFCVHFLGLKHRRQITTQRRDQIDSHEDKADFHATWYELKVNYVSYGTGYLFETFTEEPPQYISVWSIKEINGGPVVLQSKSATSSVSLLSYAGGRVQGRTSISSRPNVHPSVGKFVFDTFHVGQGMCSLVHNNQVGILLDVGAGKPITRDTYITNAIRNDLRTAVNLLAAPVNVVLSHADSDHWRILSWDSVLLTQIHAIYIPAGVSSLAFKDRAIKRKVIGISDHTWMLDNTTCLRVFRSAPLQPDRNGECLVSLFKRGRCRVLAAGDYVYERFGTDSNPNLRGLSRPARYSAVVVPHHGDAASANNVVGSTVGAKAFFSAGTHRGYKHPTAASLSAHRIAHFKNISRPTLPDIVRVRLL
ncbi:hypothetical protein GALL_88350 [mine drainage metagenome]|uniref:Metallo-beta-lactamase domain-containing protein n=1 Tax=mine drainage metagenome TaxID=410659 RepID=A0A1J5SK57_9ZZZZ